MAKSTKGGLGRGLDALLGSYEDTVKTAPAPTPAARPAQIPAPSQRRLKEEEVLEREEINETYPEDNIHIKGVVQRRAAVQATIPAAANEVVSHEPSSRVVEKVSNEVPIDSVRPNPDQPRTQFKKEELQELSSSIEAHGLLQPILVRKTGTDAYEIIAGERRWQACKMAGLKKIPICIKEADDDNSLELALIENIQREDLNAIEIALGMQRLIDECNLTQEALSEKVGKKRSTVSNYMRLLKLPNEVQLALKEGLISMGHAKAIAGAPEELQLRLLKKCIRKGLSVRQIEELVRALTDPAAKPAAPAEDEEYPESYARLVEQLEKFFSQEISIKRSKNGGGRIVIDFSDDRDIDRFIEKFEKRGASAEIRNNK